MKGKIQRRFEVIKVDGVPIGVGQCKGEGRGCRSYQMLCNLLLPTDDPTGERAEQELQRLNVEGNLIANALNAYCFGDSGAES